MECCKCEGKWVNKSCWSVRSQVLNFSALPFKGCQFRGIPRPNSKMSTSFPRAPWTHVTPNGVAKKDPQLRRPTLQGWNNHPRFWTTARLISAKMLPPSAEDDLFFLRCRMPLIAKIRDFVTSVSTSFPCTRDDFNFSQIGTRKFCSPSRFICENMASCMFLRCQH